MPTNSLLQTLKRNDDDAPKSCWKDLKFVDPECCVGTMRVQSEANPAASLKPAGVTLNPSRNSLFCISFLQNLTLWAHKLLFALWLLSENCLHEIVRIHWFCSDSEQFNSESGHKITSKLALSMFTTSPWASITMLQPLWFRVYRFGP